MSKSPLTTALLAILTASALLSVVLCWSFISNTRVLPSLRVQAAIINNNRLLFNALTNDVLIYSKDNPAILPLLEAAAPKPSKPGTVAAPKPAAK
jgi:hypothetical protein